MSGGPLSYGVLKALGSPARVFEGEIDYVEFWSLVGSAGGLSLEAVDELRRAYSRPGISKKDLLSKAAQILPYDSSVRDVITLGHCAKVLCRWEAIARFNDVRIGGLRLPVFDALSQHDRHSFFAQGGGLEVEADLAENSAIHQLLREEKTKFEKLA